MKPMEEANKLATFGTLRDQGESLERAAYQTRKYGGSPDWAQSGRADHLLRYMITFGRPALLGVETALRAGARNPKRLGAVMAGTMALEVARQSFNQLTADALGVSEEELENRFSEYDKDNTFLMMIPPEVAEKVFGAPQETLSNGISRPFALKVPIPPILRLYTAPFKGMAKAIREGNPAELPIAIADEMIPGTVPLKGENLPGTMGRRALASTTAPIRATLEQAMDMQGFTGAPIVGSRLEGLPAEEQFSESTQPFYKTLGKTVGGSPVRLQHLGKTFLPGVLETPVQLLNKMEPSSGVPPVEKGELERLADIPFLGPAFARRVTPQRYESELGSLQDDFYSLAGKTKASAGAVGKFEKGIGGLPSELVQALGAANPEVTGMVRALAELSTAQKQIVASPEMDGAAKREALKGLVDQKRELLKAFLSNPTVQLLLDDKTQPE
jgi:hypothetical protein